MKRGSNACSTMTRGIRGVWEWESTGGRLAYTRNGKAGRVIIELYGRQGGSGMPLVVMGRVSTCTNFTP